VIALSNRISWSETLAMQIRIGNRRPIYSGYLLIKTMKGVRKTVTGTEPVAMAL
jgi:hypothetical protein